MKEMDIVLPRKAVALIVKKAVDVYFMIDVALLRNPVVLCIIELVHRLVSKCVTYPVLRFDVLRFSRVGDDNNNDKNLKELMIILYSWSQCK